MTAPEPPYPGGPYTVPPAPVPGAPAASYPPAAYPPGPPARRSSSGWLTAGIVLAVLVALGACCGLSLVSVFRGSDGGDFGVGDAVAVISLDGVITGTSSSGGLTAATGATPVGIVSQLDKADEDSSVKAIVLRIDSPGGSAAASHEIAEEVRRAEKPIVASIGDVGASGAYMIAAQCDEIVADANSSVGSIGVIMELPELQELLKKLGIDFTIIKQGKYKDIGSPFRPITPAERALVEAQTKVVYDRFIGDVAKGRKLPAAKVREYATGFVFLGSEAETMGLVDSLGTFRDAKDRAAELGGIDGSFRVVTYEADALGGLLDALLGLKSALAPAAGLRGTGPSLPR